MSNFKGTPGPWKAVYNEKRGNHTIETDHGDWREMPVAFTATHFVSGSEPANAQMMAAAPELLEALEEALPFVERVAATQPTQPHNALKRDRAIKARDKIRAAIAKATGDA